MNTKSESATGPAEAAAKVHEVQDENRDVANRDMPGKRAALPPGSLPRPKLEPQADENRDQPVAPDGSLTTPSKPPSAQ